MIKMIKMILVMMISMLIPKAMTLLVPVRPAKQKTVKIPVLKLIIKRIVVKYRKKSN